MNILGKEVEFTPTIGLKQAREIRLLIKDFSEEAAFNPDVFVGELIDRGEETVVKFLNLILQEKGKEWTGDLFDPKMSLEGFDVMVLDQIVNDFFAGGRYGMLKSKAQSRIMRESMASILRDPKIIEAILKQTKEEKQTG